MKIRSHSRSSGAGGALQRSRYAIRSQRRRAGALEQHNSARMDHGAGVRLRGKLLPVVFLHEAMGGHVAGPAAKTTSTRQHAHAVLAVVQVPDASRLVVERSRSARDRRQPLPKELTEIARLRARVARDAA